MIQRALLQRYTTRACTFRAVEYVSVYTFRKLAAYSMPTIRANLLQYGVLGYDWSREVYIYHLASHLLEYPKHLTKLHRSPGSCPMGIHYGPSTHLLRTGKHGAYFSMNVKTHQICLDISSVISFI